MAVNKERFVFTGELCRRMEFSELAELPEFRKTFARCMLLPGH